MAAMGRQHLFAIVGTGPLLRRPDSAGAKGSQPQDIRRPIEQSTGAANDRLALVTVLWKRVSERQQPLRNSHCL